MWLGWLACTWELRLSQLRKASSLAWLYHTAKAVTAEGDA
jgi:hypothetical protein